MINSDDLRFFHTVASSSTLSAVARFLDITPPSVTQRLQNIESKLGVKLIIRPARKIILTDEGEILLDRAARILSDIDALQDVVDNTRSQVSGTLRVLAPLGFGYEYVAPLLADYADEHPGLMVDLTLSDAPNWMLADKWDVVIYIGHLRDSSLHCTRLASNRRYLCASPAYIARAGAPQHPDDLRHHSCLVIRENAEDVTRWKFRKGDREYAIRISPRLSSNDGRIIKKWSLAGGGIMIRSGWDIRQEIEQGTLVHLLPDYRLPEADIVALTSLRESARPLRVQKFLDFLKESFNPPSWEK